MESGRSERAFTPVRDFETDEHGRVIKFKDPMKNQLAMQQRTREDWIQIEYITVLRNRLGQCYLEEGVNNYKNCKEIAEQYLKLWKDPHKGALYAKKK